MIEKYLRYNEINRAVLHLLQENCNWDKLESMMQEREELFRTFEKAGWPDADKAEVIIRDSLKLERKCIKAIAMLRKVLKGELNSLKNRKYALGEYAAHAHYF